jgi:hypothetical protein
VPVATDWRQGIIDAARAPLTEPGAVVVRLNREGPEVVSRVYRLADYDGTVALRRVAIRRATQLLNADQEGWNYYAVVRYPEGAGFVAWTGMHSILAEADQGEQALTQPFSRERECLAVIAAQIPKGERVVWRSAADFMEHVATTLDRYGFGDLRPEHYED